MSRIILTLYKAFFFFKSKAGNEDELGTKSISYFMHPKPRIVDNIHGSNSLQGRKEVR